MIWPVVRLPWVRVIYLYLYQIPQVLTTATAGRCRPIVIISGSLMTVTWLPASLSNTEISNPLNIFCHLKIQCFVAGVSSTSGGFGFRELDFFDNILQLDKEF